jgi:predicted PurR-regulated permease PerM
MTQADHDQASPQWSPSTKLVVGVMFLVLISALLVRFRNIIGPLLLAFILAYVLHPLVSALAGSTRLSWRAAANAIFFLLIILLGGLLSITGLAVVQQLQSLVVVVQRFVVNLPDLVEDIPIQVYRIGPFEFDLSQFLDLGALSEQILSVLQPTLGRAGNLIGSLATSAAITVGWSLFIILVAYFLLADAGRGFPKALFSIDIPGYQYDITRMVRELGRIWNAFLRGQLVIFTLTVIIAAMLMTALGVRFALGLAILAGFARFVPYVGPLTTWVVSALVAFFQESNYFGLPPWQYAVLVVLVVVILDQVFDNLVTPRLMGETLGVHPAAVLIAAIVATNLIGIIGLLLAAPVLATLQLFGRYGLRKIFDLDPWPEPEVQRPEFAWSKILDLVWSRVKMGWERARKWKGETKDVEG